MPLITRTHPERTGQTYHRLVQVPYFVRLYH